MNRPSVPTKSSFRLALLGALALASMAVADTVGLSGTVSSTASVTSVATAGATTLNMGGVGTAIGQQIVKVADVALTTNNTAGLTLTVTSGNLTNGTDDVAYKVTTVADAASAPLSAAFTIASGTDYTVATSAQGAAAKDLYIAYTPAAVLDPGTYTATITLSVADN
jgi:hypothetical protein